MNHLRQISGALLWLSWLGCATPAARQPEPAAPVVDAKSLSQLERALGDAAEREIVALFRVEDDPRQLNRVRATGRRLLPVTPRTEIAYSFHVLDTKTINAFSLPNGRILLTRGILELFPEDDELAAVVAHELAHVTHKDAVREFERVERTLWQRLLLAETLSLVPLAGQRLGYLLLDRGFDHATELEADRTGADYLAAAGLDPQTMVRMLEAFARHPEARNRYGVFTTHPSDRTRLEALRAHLAQQPQPTSQSAR